MSGIAFAFSKHTDFIHSASAIFDCRATRWNTIFSSDRRRMLKSLDFTPNSQKMA